MVKLWCPSVCSAINSVYSSTTRSHAYRSPLCSILCPQKKKVRLLICSNVGVWSLLTIQQLILYSAVLPNSLFYIRGNAIETVGFPESMTEKSKKIQIFSEKR